MKQLFDTHNDVQSAAPETSTSDPRLLSPEECEKLARRVLEFTNGNGTTSVVITSSWTGGLSWARNKMTLASDRRNGRMTIDRKVGSIIGRTITNQFDDASLRSAVLAAERQILKDITPPDVATETPEFPRSEVHIWSDATFKMPAEARAEISHMVSREADRSGMFSAGYLEMHAGEFGWLQHNGKFEVNRYTQAQCSVTVRHPKGTGSGWAGRSGYDWNTIDGPALAKRALDKCLASLNPVRIEPGRYTVVLEPQAVVDCVRILMSNMQRVFAEAGIGPFALGEDRSLHLYRSKLGLKIIDERITISHTPSDPQLGVLPSNEMTKITWIEKGVLTALEYTRQSGVSQLTSNENAMARWSFHMSGGQTPIEEMVETTSRGLLVTRMNQMAQLDRASLLSTGVTRDGLWLIEKGKISRPVNNLRFSDSPLFLLNQVEQLGVPVPVFSPMHPAFMVLAPQVVPPLKARDFSFTALVDAV